MMKRILLTLGMVVALTGPTLTLGTTYSITNTPITSLVGRSVEPSSKTKKLTTPYELIKTIDVNVPFDVSFQQGETCSILVDGPDNYVDALDVQMSHGKLRIRLKNEGENFTAPQNLKICITTPSLNSVSASGSTNLRMTSFKTPDDLVLIASGASDINLGDVSCQKLTLIISGSSDVKLAHVHATKVIKLKASGSSDFEFKSLSSSSDISIECSGSSDGKIRQMEAATVTCNASGACDVELLNAKCKKMKVHASGSSNIKISGSTQWLVTKETGSSEIKRKGLKVG